MLFWISNPIIPNSERSFCFFWILNLKVLDNPFFMENQDYVLLHNIVEQKGSGGHNRKDYALTIDTGKKVVMAEQTDTGNEVRDYFLKCEETARHKIQVPQTFHEALRLAADQEEQMLQLEEVAKEQAPKVQLAEAISASTKSIKVGEFAKVISSQSGAVIGQKNLFKWLRFERILDNSNAPYQRYIDSGWFEIQEGTYENKNTNGPQVYYTTMITGMGQLSIFKLFSKSPHSIKFLNKSARANLRGGYALFGREATA